jgi:hypothetical protein
VQRPVPGGDEGAHGVEVGEIESADADGLVAGRAADIDSGPLAGGRVAYGEHHLCARGRERSSGLDADARRCAGHDRAPAGEIDALGDVPDRGLGAEACANYGVLVMRPVWNRSTAPTRDLLILVVTPPC